MGQSGNACRVGPIKVNFHWEYSRLGCSLVSLHNPVFGDFMHVFVGDTAIFYYAPALARDVAKISANRWRLAERLPRWGCRTLIEVAPIICMDHFLCRSVLRMTFWSILFVANRFVIFQDDWSFRFNMIFEFSVRYVFSNVRDPGQKR
jgi:hypothetical protein